MVGEAIGVRHACYRLLDALLIIHLVNSEGLSLLMTFDSDWEVSKVVCWTWLSLDWMH